MTKYSPLFDKNAVLQRIVAQLHNTVEFAEVDFSDINACSMTGDNALHCIVRWGDLDAAQTLINAGVDVNKAGDLGYTPLHVDCMKGNIELVKLLIDSGADLFAMNEGDIPFTSARLAGHDAVCDFMAPSMAEAQSKEPKIWVRARIAQLKREVARLEAELSRS
jgi:ankyrin repeat protein